jgi:hypothetical protein
VTTAAGPNGMVYGEGQALITTKDGDSVSWKGMCVSKPKGLEMALPLAKINSMMIIFEDAGFSYSKAMI